MNKNLKFIKGFSKITISGICKEKGIARGNLYKGTVSKEKIEDVKEEIIKRIAKLVLDGDDNE